MKRIIGGIIAGVVLGVSVYADYDRQILTCYSSDNATITRGDNCTIRGEIKQIYIDLVDTTNVDVTVSIDPELSTMSDITLFDGNNVTEDKVLFPRFYGHDASGTALTNDSPWAIVSIGDLIKLSCENFNATNETVKAVIIYQK